MPATKYRFSARARRDLKAIARYTRETWSQQQADRYNEDLTSTFERLGEYPDLGRGRPELPVGTLAFVVIRHVIIYRTDGPRIFILRVVHQQMDLSGLDLS